MTSREQVRGSIGVSHLFLDKNLTKKLVPGTQPNFLQNFANFT
jgi:hypothetical protein